MTVKRSKTAKQKRRRKNADLSTDERRTIANKRYNKKRAAPRDKDSTGAYYGGKPISVRLPVAILDRIEAALNGRPRSQAIIEALDAAFPPAKGDVFE